MRDATQVADPIDIPALPATAIPGYRDSGSPTEGNGADRRRFRPRAALSIFDLTAVLSTLLVTLVIFRHRLANVNGTVFADNDLDQRLFEWLLTHTAHAVVHLQNPFLAPELGTPTTANLMGNTSMILPGVLLTPVTLLWGPSLSLFTLLVVSLAGTATAWYFFFRRWVTRSRPAALAGALFCGFAPGMISQANGHPHMVAQFLIPPILWVVLGLGEPDRTVRNGVRLGLLVAAQILIGEEALFLTALAVAVFLLGYAVQRPAVIRARLRGAAASLALGAAIALLLVGYPLWLQFFSPYAYHGIPNRIYSADLGSFTAYAWHTVAGDRATAARVSANGSEQVAFFGWSLLVLAAVAAGWLWRRVYVRTAVLTGVVFGLLSLGPQLQLNKESRAVALPWKLVDGLPLFHDVITVRLGLVLVPVIGLLIAASWDRAVEGSVLTRPEPLALLWPAALTAALVPVAPVPLPAAARERLPEFVTSREARQCTGTLVAYPTNARDTSAQMAWQTAAGFRFDLRTGYYIARDAHGSGRWGQPYRPTDQTVFDVARTGKVPAITGTMRQQAQEDIAYWRADCVAVADQPNARPIALTLTDLLGTTPVHTGGVWLWRLPG